MRPVGRSTVFTACSLVVGISASAADWPNAGGGPTHDGRSTEVGPPSPQVLWSGSRPSIIAWQPVTEGNRVYMVRQNGFASATLTTDSPIVCQNLTTGVEEWSIDVPYNAGDYTTWIGGVSQGRLYAARSSGGSPTVWAHLYCYDSTTGMTKWISTDVINASRFDGLVFAPNGDPVIGSPTMIWRINHLTGMTVWSVGRDTGTISGCGVALSGNSVYGAHFDQFGAGTTLRCYDLATGTFQYESGSIGAGDSNPPMVGPDGTIYKHGRGPGAGNNTLYAWTDTGTALLPKWSVPAGMSTFSEGGIGPDGTIYHFAPNNEVHRVDPATGATIHTTVPLPVDATSPTHPRFAIDAQGRVFLTNGHDSAGILASFNADLSFRWSVSFPNASTGGPALGENGTLIMAGAGTNVVAYRDLTPETPFCFGDGSGTVCPCGNFGVSGHGCASSVSPSGGLLQGTGVASVTADTLLLSGSSMPDSFALYFQGTGQFAGGAGTVFGDGLRCAGGILVRLATKLGVAGASHFPDVGDPSISVRGQIPPAGGVRTYQAWYRNAATFCTSATFNLTNGVQYTWLP